MELERQTVTLQLDIEPGMEAGQTVTLYGEGEPHPDGDSGDLNVVLSMQPHALFKRDKANLTLNVKLDLLSALAGFATEAEHVDGHKVRHCNALHDPFYLPA